jgi:VIT1/CCC1 family predicted Fe2+/Mn2+ transporter
MNNPNLSENLSVIQAIQLILAPGVMISACGLLLLGINNKFTSVLNRIRILTEEKRKTIFNAADRNFLSTEIQRIESITRQVAGLLNRARLIRNSIFCYLCAVGLFVVTSLLIGTDYFVSMLQLRYLILGTFLCGMVVVFVGVIFGVLDTMKGYGIVKFEVQVDE